MRERDNLMGVTNSNEDKMQLNVVLRIEVAIKIIERPVMM